MKKMMVLIAFLLLFSSCAQLNQDFPDSLEGQVLVLGNSITQDGRYVSVIEYELFQRFPDKDFDIVSIGLSSETVSGLTEPGHPYPRPCLHDRLNAALAKLPPSTVVACYGMNDGIYHPQSEKRFQAYKDGVLKLIERAQQINARLILLTPPVFDAKVIPDKVVDQDAEKFGYSSPFRNYNNVLQDYSQWFLSLDKPNVQVIDINGPMLDYLQEKRQQNPDFALSDDGVHPNLAGHVLMAQKFLRGLKVPIKDEDPVKKAQRLRQSELFKIVNKRRHTLSMAWLVDIGFDKPGEYDAMPVEDAKAMALAWRQKIRRMIENKNSN